MSLLSSRVDDFINSLVGQAKKNVLFITVRCPTQKSKWMTIGKVSDWARRYSKSYWIVKGGTGGTHFHLMLLLSPKAPQIRYPKGIHFRVSPIGIKTKVIPYVSPLPSEVSDRLDSEARAEHLHKSLIAYYNVPSVCLQVASCIATHFRLKNNREKRHTAVSERLTELFRVRDYMYKNLDEPRENGGLPVLYCDYIIT